MGPSTFSCHGPIILYKTTLIGLSQQSCIPREICQLDLSAKNLFGWPTCELSFLKCYIGVVAKIKLTFSNHSYRELKKEGSGEREKKLAKN